MTAIGVALIFTGILFAFISETVGPPVWLERFSLLAAGLGLLIGATLSASGVIMFLWRTMP
jgi:hypothetical protein